jgi:hypothetical protein
MQLFAGTSGYSYKEWKGPFYPDKLPADQMLRFYAERLRTVEINNTFYRMPAEAMLARLNNWDETMEMGRRGHERVHAEWTLSHMAAHTEHVFEEVAARVR